MDQMLAKNVFLQLHLKFCHVLSQVGLPTALPELADCRSEQKLIKTTLNYIFSKITLVRSTILYYSTTECPKKTCAVCNAIREIVLKNVVLAANRTSFFGTPCIYKQDLSRVFFIIHHLPSQFCRFLRDKNGKKWQISAGYNSCYSGSILLGVVTRWSFYMYLSFDSTQLTKKLPLSCQFAVIFRIDYGKKWTISAAYISCYF